MHFSSEITESKIGYINMIRDPIARFESFYYFSRFGNVLGGGGKAKLTDEQRHETIDECILNKRRECVKPWWQVVPYLCGQHPKCMERGRWAVEQAKVSSVKFLFEYKFEVWTIPPFQKTASIQNANKCKIFENFRVYFSTLCSTECPKNPRCIFHAHFL